MLAGLLLGVIVNFSWDASPGGADGYYLAYGDQPGQYTQTVEVGQELTGQIDLDLDSGPKYVVAHAYSEAGETRLVSDPSNEVKVPGKPKAPLTLEFAFPARQQ